MPTPNTERKQALIDLNQSKLKTLNQFMTEIKVKVTKIGEGAFGEVFMAVRQNKKTIIKVSFFSVIK